MRPRRVLLGRCSRLPAGAGTRTLSQPVTRRAGRRGSHLRQPRHTGRVAASFHAHRDVVVAVPPLRLLPTGVQKVPKVARRGLSKALGAGLLQVQPAVDDFSILGDRILQSFDRSVEGKRPKRNPGGRWRDGLRRMPAERESTRGAKYRALQGTHASCTSPADDARRLGHDHPAALPSHATRRSAQARPVISGRGAESPPAGRPRMRPASHNAWTEKWGPVTTIPTSIWPGGRSG